MQNPVFEVDPLDEPEPDAVAAADGGPGAARRFYVRHEYAVIYAVAALSYTLIGVHAKFLLNWIVSPLWPIVFIWVGPVLVRRVTGWKAPLP